MRPLQLAITLLVPCAALLVGHAVLAREELTAPAAPNTRQPPPSSTRTRASVGIKSAPRIAPAQTTATFASAPETRAAWPARLRAQLAAADRGPGEIGVYVRHLGTGDELSFRGDERWYLASGVKVPVAVAVLREIERGHLNLNTRLGLEAADRVDGTGSTNHHRPGALLRVDYLLEQMLVYSDNTATDMLIRKVGLGEINRLTQQLSGWDFRITTLADVRRLSYGALHPEAAALTFTDWVELRRTAEPHRLAALAKRAGVPLEELAAPSLDATYEAYYQTHHNSAPLRAYGQLLEELTRGQALGPEGTAYLLDLMSRIRTGKRRIEATLPAGTRFSHKTGTQHRRLCDLGVARRATNAHVVVAACVREFPSLAAGELALRRVGIAVAASGVLDALPLGESRREDAKVESTSNPDLGGRPVQRSSVRNGDPPHHPDR